MSPTITGQKSASKTGFEGDLPALLDGLPTEIQALARDLVAALLHIRPEFIARVRLGWRSINFRHPQAGFTCAVFPYRDHVDLIFEHGRQLSNDAGLLQGSHSQIRLIPFHPGDSIPETEIALLLAESIALKS